ncbi:MAG: hypothetical protein OEW83_03635 [Acidimicrobiia bacterium]|nr:hypothetical protein [Acidimicrobiia bacterium]
MTDVTPVSLETVARLHGITTWFHVFVYSAPEATEEFDKVGLDGRSGYFASRSAPMGPVPPEVITATFYNFPPALVERWMRGRWEAVSPTEASAARWRAVGRVLNTHVRPVMPADAIAEATDIAQRVVDGLAWPGRPLAAGHAAILDQCPDDDLVRLWQLVAVLREWRGDGHIALLTAEPLSGAECTVISYALSKGRSFLKASRSWGDDEWSAAVDRLTADGWISADEAMTEEGQVRRRALETRTNELAAAMWEAFDHVTANRLGDLLEPAVEALTAADYFAMFGRPAPKPEV